MNQNDTTARTDALEEAAKVCDEKAHVLTIMGFHDKAAAARNCAAEIRAQQTKGAPTTTARNADALDAARYRWLRDVDWLKTDLVKMTGNSIFQFVGKGLDAAVDKARSKA